MVLTQTACTMAPVRQGAFIFYADHLTNRSTTSRFAACSGEMQGQYWMVRQAGCARRGMGAQPACSLPAFTLVLQSSSGLTNPLLFMVLGVLIHP